MNDLQHHYVGRTYQAGGMWAWVIEDGGAIVMRGASPSETAARSALDEELAWLDPKRENLEVALTSKP